MGAHVTPGRAPNGACLLACPWAVILRRPSSAEALERIDATEELAGPPELLQQIVLLVLIKRSWAAALPRTRFDNQYDGFRMIINI